MRGEGRERGANLVHGPNACAKANEAFHEHGPNAPQGANSANRLSEAATRLSARRVDVSFEPVKEKSNLWLAVALMAVFALTRLPNMLPLNFSAAYAVAFCAGVYLPRRMA